MGKITEKYFELIRAFPLRPISSEAELKRAIKAADCLADRGETDLTADERGYLEVLSDLIEKYEDDHYHIEESTPAQMLAFFIGDRNIKQKDLAAATGIPVSTISELLSEKRAFTMNHVERLAAYLEVNPSLFVTVKRVENLASV